MPDRNQQAIYEAEYLHDGITWIDECCLRQPGNIWLVEGAQRALLIDTGRGLGNLREFVSSLTSRPVTAIATIGYFDHAGGLNQFATNAIHRADAHRVTQPNAQKAAWESYAREDCWRASWASPSPACSFSDTPVSIERELEEADVLDIGERQLEVLHLPGITNGSIGLYESASGALFTGDTLLDTDPPYDGEPGDVDLEALCHSMRRIAELPIKQVYPGHGSPYDETRLRIVLREFFERHRLRQ